MENEFNKIDDLFRDSFSDYSETPPSAVWPALEKRLDERKKRRVFPLLRWYWLGALLAFVSLLGATLVVDMKPTAPEVAEKAVLPLNTAPALRANAPETKAQALNVPADQTKRTAARKSNETKGGATSRNSNNTINISKGKDRPNKRDEEQAAGITSVAATETSTSKNAPAIGTSVYSYDDFEERDDTKERPTTGAQAIAGNAYAAHATGKHKIVVVEVAGETPFSDRIEPAEVATTAVTVNRKNVKHLSGDSGSNDAIASTAGVSAKPRTSPKSHSSPQPKSGSAAQGIANADRVEVAGAKRALAATPSPNRTHKVADRVRKKELPSRLAVATTASVAGKDVKTAERKLKNGGAQVALTTAPQNGAASKVDARNEKRGKEEGNSGNAARQALSAKATTANAAAVKAGVNAKPVTETLVSASASPKELQRAHSGLPKNINAHSKEAVMRPNVNASSSKGIVNSSRTLKKEQKKTKVAERIAAALPIPAQIRQGALVRAEGRKLPGVSKLPATPSTQSATPGEDSESGEVLPVAKLPVGSTSPPAKQEVGIKAKKTATNESPAEKKSAVSETAAKPKAKEALLPVNEPVVASAAKSNVVAKPVVNAKAKVPSVIASNSKVPEAAIKEKHGDVSPADIAKAPLAAGAKREADSAALSIEKSKAEEQQPDSSVQGITPLMKFVFGIKGGLESGFSMKAGNKLVVAPYVRYNLNDKLGIVLQPSIKLGRVSTRLMGSPTAYHNVHAGTGHYELDSQSLVYLAFTGDTLVRRDYTYTEKYDSIIKQNQVGGTYVEFELPILLQYQISTRLSLLGGFNIVMGKRFSIVEKTKEYNDVTATGHPMTLSGLNQPEVLPVATGVNYTSSPISSYGGPSFPANNSNLVRMGYMLGASYEWKKRWTMDATIQQCFVQKNVAGGYNLNSALSAPYFRFSIGYRLTK